MRTSRLRTRVLVALAAVLLVSAGLSACGDDDGDGPAKLGETCDATQQQDACADDDAVCAEDPDKGETTCQLQAGARCDLDADNPHCLAGNECEEVPDPDDDSNTIGECRTAFGNECDPLEPHCSQALLCAERQDGGHACYEPVVLRGMVIDATTDEAIEGAHVIALDKNSIAVSDVAVTDENGNYELSVPVQRLEDGTPVDDTAFILRSSAQNYQTFPGGIRQAIPVLSSEAARETTTNEDDEEEGKWVIESSLTTVELIPLPAGDRVSISGSVVTQDANEDGVDDDGAGVLAVAHGVGVPAPTGISDLSGHYTIFNVPAGSVEVRGYKQGLQLQPVSVSVANENVEDVDLVLAETGTSTVSGQVSIVNPGDGDATSIVLAVQDTFTENFGRGEVPAGVRTPLNVTGAWSIDGVPAGSYVVLAAFENDMLVRDPDQNIAGTETVVIDVVAGQDQEIAEAFKVTGALAVFEPGETLPTPVSSAPALVWEDDSSEAFYDVRVFNSLGELVWENAMIPEVSGSNTVTVQYEGPMTPGMYYQFRARSWRAPGGQNPSPISATEDLRGVFFVE